MRRGVMRTNLERHVPRHILPLVTPAILLARKAGVPHDVLAYAHDPKAPSYGLEAAERLGLEPSSVFKTLVVEVDGVGLACAVVPVSGMLDLKALVYGSDFEPEVAATVPRVSTLKTLLRVGAAPPRPLIAFRSGHLIRRISSSVWYAILAHGR